MTPRGVKTNHSRSRSFAAASALGLVLLLGSPLAHGEIYRWIDDQGVTHFSQTPPPRGDYQQVQPPPPPAQDPRQAQQEIDAINKDVADREKAQQKQLAAQQRRQAALKQQEQRCTQARQRLTALTIRPHILVKGRDGGVRRLTEPERQADIAATRKTIEKTCPQ